MTNSAQMDYFEKPGVIRLIAWLSLCLLAAAWCPTLDQSCRVLWAHSGLFGLIAAVGLESAETGRAVRRLISMSANR